MKTIIIYLILIFTIVSCSNKINYYHGHIYNSKNPLNNLKITGRDHPDTNTKTNKKGYFKMKKKKNFIEKFLYIYNDNAKIDSIQVIRGHSDRGISYYFVEGRNDTIFIDYKN